MKDILETLLFGLLIFGICYLVGSFAAADFNISNWDDTMRGFAAFFGGILSLSGMAVYYFEQTYK